MAYESQRAEGPSSGTPVATPPANSSDTSPQMHEVSEGQRRRPFPTRYVLYGLLVVLLGLSTPYGWQLWQYYQTHESTDDAYVVGDIVPMSPQVNGTVLAVHVVDNQTVEANSILAQLDPRDFEARVKQVEAAVAVAVANLRRAEIEVRLTQESTSTDTQRTSATLRGAQIATREAQQSIAEAEARLRTTEAAVAAAVAEIDMWHARREMAQAEFVRMQSLRTDGVVSQQQFDAAESGLKSAQAQQRASQQRLAQAQAEVERARVDLQTRQHGVERSQARTAEAQAVLAGAQANRQTVDIKQAQVQTAQALLQQAQADLDTARLQLSYTTLRAPIAGVIARKRLEVGQVVQAGRPFLAIVPMYNLWVEANFKETQLRHMRPGQKASLHIDAYPDQVFTGTIESLSPGTGSVFSLLPPENATGNFVKVVQRLPIKILLDPSTSFQFVLRPGMSVIATVATRD
jgi:membrane fusion protein (multidrug efflux system)